MVTSHQIPWPRFLSYCSVQVVVQMEGDGSPVEDEGLLLSYFQLLPEQVKALVARERSLLLTLFLH